MKRLAYAGKSASDWGNKYLYEILAVAHHATEEAKTALPPAPTEDELIRLAYRVAKRTEKAIDESYKESPYFTPGSDAGRYRYLNRLGLIKGVWYRLCILLRMGNEIPEHAILTNRWLQDVFQEAQEQLRLHATAPLTFGIPFEHPGAGLHPT